MRATIPIPVRWPPLVDEDLDSFVARNAEKMGYENVRWLLHPERPAGADIETQNLALLSRRDDYQLLESLLALDEEELYDHTLHRFTLQITFDRPAVEDRMEELGTDCIARPLLARGHSPKFFRSAKQTAVCAPCLREGTPHGRLAWRMHMLPVCIRHTTWLLERCPGCRRQIPVLRRKVVQCPYCDADYRDAPHRPGPEDPYFWAGEQVILQRLALNTHLNNAALRAPLPDDLIGSPVLDLPAPCYFDVLYLLGGRILTLPSDVNCLRLGQPGQRPPRGNTRIFTSTQAEWAMLVASAHYIFSAWPRRFHEFLAVLDCSRADTTRVTGLRRSFGPLYTEYLYDRWQATMFSFLRDAFDVYLARQFAGSSLVPGAYRLPGRQGSLGGKSHRYVTCTTAASVLQCTSNIVSRLVAIGVLHGVVKYSADKRQPRCYLITRQSLDMLSEEWRRLEPWHTLVRRYVGEAYDQTFPPTLLNGPAPWLGGAFKMYRRPLYDPIDFARWVTEIVAHATPGPASGDALPLHLATHNLRLSLFAALDELMSGHLFAVDSERDEPLAQRLLITQDEIRRYLDERAARRRTQAALLTAAEAAAALGVGRKRVLEWASCGLIQGIWRSVDGKRMLQFFTQTEVARFSQHYVLPQDAAVILGVAAHAMTRFVARGKLESVQNSDTGKRGSHLFRRADVLALEATRRRRAEQTLRKVLAAGLSTSLRG
jgi:hypothetical protein